MAILSRRYRRNDKPRLEIQITKDSGGFLDLTGATIKFSMRDQDTQVLKITSATATITDATKGKCAYDFAASDLDTKDKFYDAEFEVTLAGGQRVTFPEPPDGFIQIEVVEDLNAT